MEIEIGIACITMVFVLLAEAMRQMGQDAASEPACCPDCRQVIEEGADMALEDAFAEALS